MIPLLDGYDLVTPSTLTAALAELARHPASRPFAGGTDLMVVLEAGYLPAGRYVSLSNCSGLRGIHATREGVSLGALTTYTDIRRSPVLSADYPLLAIAAAETGGLATQNRGTIGGNIANGSPAADTPPALLVYDAELELQSIAGTRRIPYASFHRGYKQMDLLAGELIVRVHLPKRASRQDPLGEGETAVWREYYRKVGTRRAQAISKVCVAGAIRMDGDRVDDVRIALGSVAPVPLRAVRTEKALRGATLSPQTVAAAEQALAAEIAPIDDIRSNARYRTRVAVNLLREFLELRGV